MGKMTPGRPIGARYMKVKDPSLPEFSPESRLLPQSSDSWTGDPGLDIRNRDLTDPPRKTHQGRRERRGYVE
jgi:hypothetical protein